MRSRGSLIGQPVRQKLGCWCLEKLGLRHRDGALHDCDWGPTRGGRGGRGRRWAEISDTHRGVAPLAPQYGSDWVPEGRSFVCRSWTPDRAINQRSVGDRPESEVVTRWACFSSSFRGGPVRIETLHKEKQHIFGVSVIQQIPFGQYLLEASFVPSFYLAPFSQSLFQDYQYQ